MLLLLGLVRSAVRDREALVAENLLHVVEALVQAYLFGMLALVYIAGGIESQPRPDGANAS